MRPVVAHSKVLTCSMLVYNGRSRVTVVFTTAKHVLLLSYHSGARGRGELDGDDEQRVEGDGARRRQQQHQPVVQL